MELDVGQEDKALVSWVGVNYEDDFTITFRDAQNLQYLRKQIFRCRPILDASLTLATQLHRNCTRMLREETASLEYHLGHLEACTMQLGNYKGSLDWLLHFSDALLNIVCTLNTKILLLGGS